MPFLPGLIIFIGGMLAAGLSLQVLCMAKVSKLREEAAHELHPTQPE